MSLDFKGWQNLDATHLQALAQSKAANHTFASGITIASSTLASLPAGTSVSFTKLYTASALRVDMYTYPWVSGSASTEIDFTVQINSVDYGVCSAFFNALSLRHLCSGVRVAAGGLTAGTYTVQPRWRRTAGSGTGNLDTASRFYMSVMEVRQ